MSNLYKYFKNAKGFSIGAEFNEIDLKDYHPPINKDSPNHITKNVIINEGYNNEYVGTEIPTKAAEAEWGSGVEIFNVLKMRAFEEDINEGISPVNRIIHKRIGLPFAGYILESYELRRILVDECKDSESLVPSNMKKHKGEIFVDIMTWSYLSKEDYDYIENEYKKLNVYLYDKDTKSNDHSEFILEETQDKDNNITSRYYQEINQLDLNINMKFDYYNQKSKNNIKGVKGNKIPIKHLISTAWFWKRD